MSSTEGENQTARLEALLGELNDPGPTALSQGEVLSQLLASSNEFSTRPPGVDNRNVAPGSASVSGSGVTEDFVQLSIPGYSESNSAPGGIPNAAVSPLFSLGSASRSSSRGGSFGKEAEGKEFNVVFVEENRGVCFGNIGDGGKFCLRKSCSIAAHRSASKFHPTAEGSVVIAKSRDVAFASPALGGSVLPEDVFTSWCNTAKTLPSWLVFFQAAEQHDEEFTTSGDYEASLREKQTSNNLFNTPKKERPREDSFVLSEVENLQLYDQAVETSRKDPFKRANPGALGEVVLGVDSGLHDLSVSFKRHMVETQDALNALKLSGNTLEGQQQSASSLLGSLGHLGGSSFQSPTVFGTLAAIGAKVEEMWGAAPPVVDLSPLESKINKLRAETSTNTATSIGCLTSLIQKVKALELVCQGGAWSPPGPALPPLYPAAVVPIAPAAPTPLELKSLSDRLDALEMENIDQQLEIQRLISASDETAVKFSGLGLKSLAETTAWVALHSQEGDLDFSLVTDAYFIFDLIAGEEEASTTLMLQGMNNRKKLGLGSAYQAGALAAFQLEVPRLFHGTSNVGSFASGSGDSQLKNLPNVDKWSLGPGSMKKLIERKLSSIRTSFRQTIENQLKPKSRIHGLAIEALERAISWIISLCSWMDRAYENAHIISKMSKAKAWSLVTQLVRRVFAELYVVRMDTVRSMHANDHQSMCAGVLWAVFRTHDKMNEFDSAKFEDHPAIASEHIKFLACNSGFESLETLEHDFAVLKVDLKESDRKLAASLKKIDTASTGADTNKRAIADLARRVDKKSDK